MVRGIDHHLLALLFRDSLPALRGLQELQTPDRLVIQAMSSLAQFLHSVKKGDSCHVQFLDNNTVEELLFLCRELDAAGSNVVEKGGLTVTLFLTCGACQPVGGEARHIRLAVFPHEMNDPICLCKSLIRATGTLEMGRILLGMPGGDV